MQNSQLAIDEIIAAVRKTHCLGRFKVRVAQSDTHPDQRPMDESWVRELSTKIGGKENLNRALHPIGVVLEDGGHEEDLRILAARNKEVVPDLPSRYRVLVFAGQHRLALLSCLGLVEPEDRWWHADVFSARIQNEHPAEFLAMMHESNLPTVMKASSDVELFSAVVKLKALFEAGKVKKAAFLAHRQALLGHDPALFKAISALSRNNDLASAISAALSRPHIAKTFHAGSWKRLTAGRLWGVASGLVREMICQVDLLTKGMIDVPDNVVNLKLRGCEISNLESESKSNSKKSQRHVWGVLPGGLSGALERVKNRPTNFVTPLNPKVRYGWSIPHLVLLPSCLGSVVVEKELTTMKTAVVHLLRICADPAHFKTYIGGSSETIETCTDHPAGMIAHVLKAHKDSSKTRDYEQKIIHYVWKNREALCKGLEAARISDAAVSTQEDYTRLVTEDFHWWELIGLLRMRSFPSGWRIAIPKEFKATTPEDSQMSGGTPIQAVTASDDVQAVAGQKLLIPHHEDSQPSMKRKRNDVSAIQAHAPKKRATKLSPAVLPEHVDESDIESGKSTDPLPPRTGGDRQLGRMLGSIEALAQTLTRAESQALSCLLSNVILAKKQNVMVDLVTTFNMQSSVVLGAEEAQAAQGAGSTTDIQIQSGAVHSEEVSSEEEEVSMDEFA